MAQPVFRTEILVGWGDCDPLGIVYYPNYFSWFDDGTHGLLGGAGFSQRQIIDRFGVLGTPLVDAGADMLHCSQRRFWEPEFPAIDGESGLNFAGWAKKITGVPTISVGSVGLDGADFLGSFGGAETSASASGLEKLVSRMEKDEFDLIAVGRALIKDPEWVKKVEAGEIDKLRAFSRETLAELV